MTDEALDRRRIVRFAQRNARARMARGYLGVSTAALPGRRGAVVAAVQRGGPPDRGGLAPGDIVVRLGEREINEPGDLVGATLEMEAGQRVPIVVERNGRRETKEVELGRRPPLRRVEAGGR